MNKLYKICSVLFLFFSTLILQAQDNRTINTKVADILAQLPTEDLAHSDRLMQEIIDLGTEGILKFSDMLVPLGSGDDTKARYALQSVAIYSGSQKPNIETSELEEAFLIALKKESNAEVKTFLMDRLQYIGTNKSIKLLGSYLLDDQLFKPALAALFSIGTNEAASEISSVIQKANTSQKIAFVDILGALKYKSSVSIIEEIANFSDGLLHQKALIALANIASPDSYQILLSAVQKSNFQLDDSKSIIAFIAYGNQLQKEGNVSLSSEVAKNLIKNCVAENQLHFRSAAVHLLRANEGNGFMKTLIKEAQHKDKKYVGAVLEAASLNSTSLEVTQWAKLYHKLDSEIKPLLIGMLAKSKDPIVFDKVILSALKDKNEVVRIAGIKALGHQNKDLALPELFESINIAVTEEELQAIEGTLLRLCNEKDNVVLANQLKNVNDQGKEVLVNVLSARKATNQFSILLGLIHKGNANLDAAIYKALPSITKGENLADLINLIETSSNQTEERNAQLAISRIVDTDEEDFSTQIYDAYTSTKNKSKLVPILASLSNDKALELVLESLSSGTAAEKKIALDALSQWKNTNAIPYLFKSVSGIKENDLRSLAFEYYLDNVLKSTYPDDQKLLLIRKLMPVAITNKEKQQVLVVAQNIKTFLSLVFVSEYLEVPELINTASNAVIAIALPTPGVKNGLSGDLVRSIVSKSVDNLTGPDSQYIKIDVKEFLDKMPNEKGFVSLFNGKDFTGWEGLVKDPIARSKMSAKQLAVAQAIANEQMMKDWFIKDGVIGFKGEGYNNICTIKDYGDFEMLVDWKITNGGDSGIYLRGTPQVQIWDIARIKDGAQVGSGGLYNNQQYESKPLVVADNPIDEWNTFRIKMVGERVTVYLNGVLVTDNTVLENYWDRSKAIFTKGAIELQAHGEDLGFRNIYVREINSGDELLTDAEKKEGFKSLLGGKELDHWIGNKTDYLMEGNELLVRPKQGGHGNLYTAQEYSDFVFKFEFKLTPGANNGLGIHTPLEGDAAYVGKELQILDNTAPIYANLKPYQYHGSVYGIIAAKRGALKPVGEWNSEIVEVKGNHIKITLNGAVIVDGDVKEASKNGTADHEEHPGLNRNKGHIAFLGHGSELAFRNIRIKDLSN
tara:strand:+ start:30350 stop:33751 length:3402 start_codon:yes stop_codon:yes gene_type:complete